MKDTAINKRIAKENRNPRLHWVNGSIALAFTLALSACVSGPANDSYGTAIDPGSSRTAEIGTLYGNYLAARHATREQDNSAAASYYSSALKSDPNNLVIRERAFLLEVTDGNFDAALAHAKVIVGERPKNRIARMVLASEEVRRGRYQDARMHMGESAMGLYNALAVDLVRAWTYAGERDFAGAERTLIGLNAFGRGDLIRGYHLGLISEYAGDAKKAEAHFLDALEEGGRGNLRVVEAYGKFLHRQGRAQEASTFYETFLEIAPDQPEIVAALIDAENRRNIPPLIHSINDGAAEAYLSVASFLNTERTSDLAIVYLQLALNLRSDLHVAKAILADIYQRNRRWEKTIQVFATIPVEHALGIEAAIQIAANLQRLERDEDAIAVLTKLVEKKPEDFIARMSLADLYRSQEKYEMAVAHYTASFDLLAAKGRSPNWFLGYARGISYHQLDRWPDAEKDLLLALELAPDQPLVLNYLGYSWVEQGYRVQDALALVEKAAELSPNNGFIIDSLGWANYHVGNYDQAIRHLERAVELEPEDPTLHDHLGDAYWKKGRFLEAGFEWQHALKLGPSQDNTAAIQQKLVTRTQRLTNG